MTGVSTDISTSFVKPGGKLSEKVFVESMVIGMGAQLLKTSYLSREIDECPVQEGPSHILEQSLETNQETW
jgi:hypothetical protein